MEDMEKLIVKAFVLLITLLVLTIGGCTAYGYKKSAELAKQGIDDNTIKCVIPNGGSSEAPCALASKI